MILLTSMLRPVPFFHLFGTRYLLIFLLYYHALHPQSIKKFPWIPVGADHVVSQTNADIRRGWSPCPPPMMIYNDQDRSGAVTPRFAKGLARGAQRCFPLAKRGASAHALSMTLPVLGVKFHYRPSPDVPQLNLKSVLYS